MKNELNRFDFIEFARSSADELLNFAYFVAMAEIYCTRSGALIPDSKLGRYSEIWFEMEIVNAIALSEWEEEGRPQQWSDRWRSDFRNDAQELIGDLIELLGEDSANP